MSTNSDHPPSHESQATFVRWRVLAWLCAAATIAYIHRMCISVPSKQIQADLYLNDEQMGWVMSSFFVTYSVFQIPAAWLGSRWGNRLILPFYMLGWSLATAWTGLAGGYFSIAASRLLNGAFQAGVLPCSAISVRQWFSVSQRSFPTGMLGSFQSVGAMAATLLTPFLLQFCDWRTAVVIFALLGLGWSVGFYMWFRDTPETHPAVNAAELRQIRGEGWAETPARSTGAGISEEANSAQTGSTEAIPATPWLEMFTSYTMVLICSQQFFRAAGYAFYGTWFPRFLQETRNVTMINSGYLTTLPVLAVVIGSAAGGRMVDWIQTRTGNPRLSRQALAIVCLSACAVCIFLAFFVANALQAVLLITLGSLCAGIGGPAGMTLTIDLSGRHVATTFATMNMAGNFGAAACPIVVAWMVEQTRQWNLVLFFFVAVHAAAAFCWIFLNPNRPIFEDERRS